MIPQVHSKWIYYGPHPGRGERHVVVFSDNESVTTCATAHAFNGPPIIFRQLFKFSEAAPNTP